MVLLRRTLLTGAPAVLAACATIDPASVPAPQPTPIGDAVPPVAPQPRPAFVAGPVPAARTIYAARTVERFPIPAIDLRRIPAWFLRTQVAYARDDEPGTIVVDTSARYAYFVLDDHQALRYGIAVGREQSFDLAGEAIIERKAEWPSWRPTPQMVARDPQRYRPLRDGLPGGGRNPLGARALYLYQDGYDTQYRLHGTIEPWSIGTMASNGCVRLINQDIVDLYGRVTIGTRVVILPRDVSVA